jgi:hypothetical protein
LSRKRYLLDQKHRKYLFSYIELKGEKCVVQRYLSKPFLIDGLKFDMRIYVLVAGTDPLRIFVY